MAKSYEDAESILMLPRVDLCSIFNNRRSLVQLAAIKHTKTTPWVDIAKMKTGRLVSCRKTLALSPMLWRFLRTF